MKEAETHFNLVASQITDAVKGQLFGKPCYKIGGKAFCCLFQDEMVFKLEGEAHQDCLSLDGASLFDPSGKGRPMKAWVQIPMDYQEKWEGFAYAAAKFVGDL